MSSPAVSELRAENESSKNNIDIRIGAVRLEIHAPTPAPAAPEPAPNVAAHEAPRFVPRRYYLRG
ncbi:MAG TPA: hypothetical protein VJS66_00885 [Burkholderiales bacterium]|nr:hypothetical protein [Burkholderiales bacterium]